MDFNNLELKISVLYSSIDAHFSSYNEVEIKTKEFVKEGKRHSVITFGGGEISKNEMLATYNKMLSVIHNLANLKDKTIDYIIKKDLNKQLVEDNINNSRYLSIIVDLCNSVKHVYPTNSKRSKLDPKITNIRKSWNINLPLSKVCHNPMDSNVQFMADIVDFNDNFICDFNELIEKSIQDWEDFFLNYIPEVSGEIALTRKVKEQKSKQILKVQHTIDEVHKILDSSEWIDVSWQELVVGMIVRNIQRENNLTNSTGIIVEQFIDENSLPTIKLKDDSPFRIKNYHVEKYSWKVIKIVKPNDLMVLSYYYYNCHILLQSIN